jgi:hypothetical protein
MRAKAQASNRQVVVHGARSKPITHRLDASGRILCEVSRSALHSRSHEGVVDVLQVMRVIQPPDMVHGQVVIAKMPNAFAHLIASAAQMIEQLAVWPTGRMHAL